jgi:adenine phosphoribosyltransferase
MEEVSIFVFLYYLIKFWSFTETIDQIGKLHPNSQNLFVKLFNKKIWIKCSKEVTKTILSTKSDSKLAYINRVFTLSHGHLYSIGNIQNESYDDDKTDPSMWHKVHHGLAKAIDTNRLDEIMSKYSSILTYKYNSKYNPTEVMSEYVMNVWFEFCFGITKNPDEDFNKYKLIREKLIKTLRTTFYNRKTSYIPYIGEYISKIMFYLYKNEYNEIDKQLRELINNSINTDGFIQEFYNQLKQTTDYDKILIDKIVLDNTFLSILVYDFINILACNSIVRFASINQNFIDRRSMKDENITNSFLFPHRMRVIGLDITLTENKSDNELISIKKGDLAIINMLEHKLFFSYGPRSCIGHAFSTKFYNKLCEIFDPYDIIKTDDNKVIKNHNRNIPEIISTHEIRLTMKKDILKNTMDNFPHKGVQKFYRIESITEDVTMFKYIITQMVERIKCIQFEQNKQIDCIVLSEARGFMFMSVGNLLSIPIIMARKKGKIAGPVSCVSYIKNYDDVETIEISTRSSSLLLNKNIVIIDDGLASGESAKALHILCKSMGANILDVIVAIRHSYSVNSKDSRTEYEKEFNIDVYNIFSL